ncbi:hypothetical protein CR513_27577, partial [Mucuna pruriens]
LYTCGCLDTDAFMYCFIVQGLPNAATMQDISLENLEQFKFSFFECFKFNLLEVVQEKQLNLIP